MKPELETQVERLAQAPILLVACDFDGVLAPIVDRPGAAAAEPAVIGALRTLEALPRTHTAIISGRGLRDLQSKLSELARPTLVGSHGDESSMKVGAVLEPGARQLLDRLITDLERFASELPGAIVEQKPLSVAFHYRQCDHHDAAAVLRRINQDLAHQPGVVRRAGHKVLELCLTPANKGTALALLRHHFGAAATLFVGDDETDELAFATLDQLKNDFGIKVGPGDTLAKGRLTSQAGVAAMLTMLAEKRAAWLDSVRIVPIQHHSLLSDQRTLALVDPAARIVWLCLPRADSAPVFAELLGGPAQGYFSIEPAGAPSEPPRRHYLGDSFILQTSWPTLTVTDYLDCTGGRAYQRAGRSDLVRVLEGVGRAIIRFAPRPDFGRASADLVIRDGGVIVEGTADPFVLVADRVSWKLETTGQHRTAVGEVDLDAGPVVLELRYGFGTMLTSHISEQERRAKTEQFWSGWTKSIRATALAPDLIKRSALVLKALCYGPTGAIYAAATTSLPEHLGGVRNWDYRYCWPRDASMAAAALVRLGNTGIAMKLLDWLVGVVQNLESPERLRPIYTVGGSHLSPEAEVGDLPGYAHSRPVRLFNAADKQVQLDVFGPIVSLIALLVEHGAPITPEHWRLVEAMVGAVAARWTEPDHGIWEVRGPRRHHVHTRAMCWHAIDRALFISQHALGRARPEWRPLRDAIRADVLTHGWNANAAAFTTAYGSPDIDAAALFIGLTGMIAPDDPHFVATVRAVDAALREGPVVYRYRSDDGLPGIEGGFNICTSWLIESLWLIGERDRARELFDQMCALAGPTGLMAEEYEPKDRMALGNFPQAYSHLGLINAAVRLSQ